MLEARHQQTRVDLDAAETGALELEARHQQTRIDLDAAETGAKEIADTRWVWGKRRLKENPTRFWVSQSLAHFQVQKPEQAGPDSVTFSGMVYCVVIFESQPTMRQFDLKACEKDLKTRMLVKFYTKSIPM